MIETVKGCLISYVCLVLSVMGAFNSLLLSAVRSSKFLGVIELKLDLHEKPKPENAVNGNEK